MTAVVTGLGVSVPSTVVTNADLERRLDTDDAWIRSRTGIAQRHIADPEVATTDLATEAAARALKSSGATDADAVVLATMTPDQPCPGSAPQVASRLGLSTAMAFDLNAACSGFLYGLMVSAGLVAAGVAQRVVLIGADIMSRTVDPADRNTSVLFGDGAGAVVIEAGAPGQAGALGPFDVGGDGELAGLLTIPSGGSRRPTTRSTVAAGEHALRMDGKEVYRQAVTHMTQSCRNVLTKAGLPLSAVDHLVGHQANARILGAVGDRLGIEESKRVVNVDRYGNTTAASIPLALADLASAGAQPGATVLLTAFGAGLSWGAAVLRWPELGWRTT
jgi:3-oxoacyl-[acyl-carrier-protein] synthase III